MHTLPEPLPSHEDGNLEDTSPSLGGPLNTFEAWAGPKNAEQRRRISEGRKNAIPKSTYVKPILRHCHECYGKHPSREDCGGHTLNDGSGACRLHHFNTAPKCRRLTKKALKQAIRAECKYCGGDGKASCGECDLRKIYEIMAAKTVPSIVRN